MAILIRGQEYANLEEAQSYSRIFHREKSFFNHLVSSNATAEFTLEPRRYHLYLGYGDPWSHRVLISYVLLELQEYLSVTMLDPTPAKYGWVFSTRNGCALDRVNGCDYLYQIYKLSEPEFTGNVSVPVLWDCKTSQIVNNESLEIMRLLNTVFQKVSSSDVQLYPDNLADEIERYNEFVFENINNGVYKVGLAPTQKIYSDNLEALFSALNELDEQLSHSRYLLGESLTEPDIKLFTSLIRFDTIYHPYMRCNRQRLQDYVHLWPYTKDIYSIPEIKKTVYFDYIMQTYYGQTYLNPMKIIPELPDINFEDEIEIFQYDFYSAPF